MNYFDYLGRKLDNYASNQFYLNLEGIKLDENRDEKALKFMGQSIFTNATKDDVEQIDYAKLLEKQEDVKDKKQKFSPLEFILREFLSIDKIKDAVDEDKNGEISEDELKKYVTELASKDANEDLTLEDFEAVIQELDINLETIKPQESQNQASTEAVSTDNKEGTQSIAVNSASEITPQIPSPVITPTPTAGNTPAIVAPSVQNTNSIDNMSLSELEAEKTKRNQTLEEKQNALNEIQSGKNENIKNAKAKVKDARKDYEKALEKDENIKPFVQYIKDNNEAIAKNEKAISENAEKISKKQNKIEKEQSVLSNLENNFSALKSALQNLSSVKDDDKDGQAKKAELQQKIQALEIEISAKKEKIEKIKTELETLKKEETQLKEQKDTLEKTKQDIDAKVQQYCNEQTKAKLEAYNNARKEFEEIKQKELVQAQSEVVKAKKAVQEIDKKIQIAKANEIKAQYLSSSYKYNDIPEKYRKDWGITEKTLPDGTKVLGCAHSRFGKCQKEWIDLQKYMVQAANEMGLTLVYSDVERTVAESNAGRARKGSLVCKGGQSPHNYGVAADIVLFQNGKPVNVNSSVQTQYAKRVKELSSNRIEWGGDWRKKGERHHFNVNEWEAKYKNQLCLVG